MNKNIISDFNIAGDLFTDSYEFNNYEDIFKKLTKQDKLLVLNLEVP